jgi:hypothetical protein
LFLEILKYKKMGRVIEWGLILYMIYAFIIKPLLRVSAQLSGNIETKKDNKSAKPKAAQNDYIDYEEIK